MIDEKKIEQASDNYEISHFGDIQSISIAFEEGAKWAIDEMQAEVARLKWAADEAEKLAARRLSDVTRLREALEKALKSLREDKELTAKIIIEKALEQ